MTLRTRVSRRAVAAFLSTLLLAGAAHAQLTVNVTPVDVDDEDPSCFMSGTVATQKIDVTNTGAQAVNATLQCSVPSGLLRVSGVDPARMVAPGATETLRCGLYDFQDPPDTGASVTDFTVDVNGASSTHTVNVQCRPQNSPVNRCAASKIGSAGQVGGASLTALSRYVRTGRSEPLFRALARGDQRLTRSYDRAHARYGDACANPSDLPTIRQALGDMTTNLNELLGNAQGRCDAGRVRAASAWYRGSMAAWSRSQRRGDTTRLVRSLIRVDKKFNRRRVRLHERFGASCSPMDVNALRFHVDRPIHTVLDAQGARRPNPDQWQAGLIP
ncbi:MAG: hypothetical protein OEP95_14985 [Myxococcales bacterium]|nr:hypothetical protein [Myxococcales bacterium]